MLRRLAPALGLLLLAASPASAYLAEVTKTFHELQPPDEDTPQTVDLRI